MRDAAYFENLRNDARCPCCQLPVSSYVMWGFTNSRYNALPCVMYWAGLEKDLAHENSDTIELICETAWLNLAKRQSNSNRTEVSVRDALAQRENRFAAAVLTSGV